MGATIIELADDFVQQLKLATFNQAFSAERHFLPKYESSKTSDLKVLVSATRHLVDFDDGDREFSQDTHTLQVGIVKRIMSQEAGRRLAELDMMSTFVQQFIDWNRTNRMFLDGAAQLSGAIDCDPFCDPDALETAGIWVTVLSISYRVMS